MTGLGERRHLLDASIDLDTHITDIVNVLDYEDLHDVILAGHSYGGMVITGVADRAIDRVGQLVYLDAAIPVNGESLCDVAPHLMSDAATQNRIVDGVELRIVAPENAHEYFGVTAPDDVAWMTDRLGPQPWRTYTQALRLTDEAAVRRIPRTIISCAATLRLVLQAEPQRWFQGDRVWEIDTGHDMMLTEPLVLAEMLERLAADTPF
jgi:pimeloyl-ACP methyl ester carboxylesterase